ncbi:MAG TPA: hypothetical protein ENN29_10005 [Candidatus Hydrogenedentes bacterium]|nr:hypothetical protein [Candidatus Hydrogenedentota bacterium]
MINVNKIRPTCALSIVVMLAILCHAEETQTSEQLAQINARANETVILLHGIGRGRASLWVLDTRLKQSGYETLNFPYAAQGCALEEIAQQLCEFIKDNVATDTYHLIAHSLGNLIIRLGFEAGYPEGLGRIVMLAPPNRPTELARALRDNPIYKWFTSESGWQFTSDEFYERLPVPEAPFGIIAGNRGQSVLLNEPNDGVITVDSTKLAGMSDWIVVPHAHTFIMNSRMVAELCVSFIETGRFHHDTGDANGQASNGGADVGDTKPRGE